MNINTMKSIYHLLFYLVFFFGSCSSDSVETNTPPTSSEKPKESKEPETSEEDIWNVSPNNQYALNVVFFNPTDYTVNEGLLNEVGNMMVYVQQWFELQMELNGYGKKTFGLVTNQQGKARIHLVQGRLASTSYQGHNEILNEIDQYFAANPNTKQGTHTFVLGFRDSGVPFYGINKIAFANTDDFKLVPTGKSIGDFQLMNCDRLGGIMHELGHGLNLPHCAHKGSDLPKVSLMSFGNHTYQNDGSERVFLTASSSAILNACEAFNTKDNIPYYATDVGAEFLGYTVEKDETNNSLMLQGTVTSPAVLNHIYVGHDGFPAGGGDNYDDITFTTVLEPTGNINEYNFSLRIPYSDLFNEYKDETKNDMQLTFNVIAKNGNRQKIGGYAYTIDLTTKIPNDDVIAAYTPFVLRDRSNWTILANTTSPNPDRVATTMLDSDLSSYWHSNYPYNIADSGPHEITIDMANSMTFSGVYLFSDRAGTNYRPKNVVIQTSNDGISFTTVKEMSLSNGLTEAKINLDNSVSSQYLRILISQVYIPSGTEENLILNEIDIISE